MAFERKDSRPTDALRSVTLRPNVVANALGSVEISFGSTRVLCCVSLDEKAPYHAQEKGIGWLTSEYSMLPASTSTRSTRESSRGKLSGRTQEIQRLIGRSLRAITDLKSLQGLTFWVDCDVLEADGGTRTASITGAYVALYLALEKIKGRFKISKLPLLEPIAAVSAGIVGGEVLLDLDYLEDSNAQVDMNLVMTKSGRFVEVQATGEGSSFSEEQFNLMKDFARKGIEQLFLFQEECIKKVL